MTDTIHTCSYHCTRPGCVKAQRDELRDRIAALEAENVELQRALQMQGKVLKTMAEELEAALKETP